MQSQKSPPNISSLIKTRQLPTCSILHTYICPQTSTIYLITPLNAPPPILSIIPSALQSINSCYLSLSQCGDLGIQKYSEIYQNGSDQKKQIIIGYANCNKMQPLVRLSCQLSTRDVLELICYLLRIVGKVKDGNFYFGSFKPERIYWQVEGNGEGMAIGGEFFGKKCSVKEFVEKWQITDESEWKYQPREIYGKDGQMDYRADLFVVGCIMYEVITGQYPWDTKIDMLNRKLPNKINFSDITKQICNKILLPSNPQSRIDPQQLLRLIELQKNKSIFSTNNLQFMPMNNLNKPGLFNNFQQFITKFTTQTEGWFLYYCQNSPDKPNDKYLQQILTKILKKSQKINKIISMLQKCAAKPIKQVNTPYSQDNSYSLLKMGLFLLNLLRKLPMQTLQPYQQCFSKISSQMLSKSPSSPLLPILYKTLSFKLFLQKTHPLFSSNFHIKIPSVPDIPMDSVEYLCQYCYKIITYFESLHEKYQNHQKYEEKQRQMEEDGLSLSMSQCEKAILACLCDQVYDCVSTVLYVVMGRKKDRVLEGETGVGRQEGKGKGKGKGKDQFVKVDKICQNIVKSIAKLCANSGIFGNHSMYAISGDYYQYQQEVCLMYEPVITSYEYFYLDKNQYKGLTLPKNYGKIYGNFKQFEEEYEDSKFMNRKPMLNRLSNLKQVQYQKQKSSTNTHKLPPIPQQQKNSSTSSPQKKSSQSLTSMQATTQKHDQFSDFFTYTQTPSQPQPSKTPAPSSSVQATCLSPSPSQKPSQPTSPESWLQLSSNDDIFSYQWLQKTSKKSNKYFSAPQLDPIIYTLYQQIISGLKLHELIQTLSLNKKLIIDPSKILFQKIIGSGSAGQVYIGKYKEEVVAIKKVKIGTNANALKEFQREVLTYIKIKSHPCLVSLVGLTKYQADYFLITEFCQGGSLFDLLHKRVGDIVLTWKERISIALDIARGMEILHFMNPPVIHRDLKSLNVFMVKRNNKWIGKVADFGLSRSPDNDMMTSALGTLHWMAPQLLTNKQYSLKVDVYSFAIVLWQICCRRTPYHNIPNQMGIVKHVVLQKGRPMLDLINAECPKQLINLMIKCWDQQPENRPYFPQIVAELTQLSKK